MRQYRPLEKVAPRCPKCAARMMLHHPLDEHERPRWVCQRDPKCIASWKLSAESMQLLGLDVPSDED